MSFPIVVVQTGTGQTTPVAVDDMQTPFNVGLSCVVSATATFSVEYSLQDPMAAGYTAGGATWHAATGFSAITATTGGALTIPCKAIRINASANTGTVTMTVVQSGPGF